MANMNENVQAGRSGSVQQQSRGATNEVDVGSPLSNGAYNVITALQAKLEGLEAYRKYSKDDGTSEIWSQLAQLETQGVGILVDELERLVQDGELRPNRFDENEGVQSNH